jgi:hypothetical protein
MNKSNLVWLIAALALGLGGIYAVWAADDSNSVTQAATVIATQNKGSVAAIAPAQPKDAVNINPFGK